MSSLYNNAVKQSNLLQKKLSEFRAAPEEAADGLVGQVSSSITAFQKAVESYATAALNELDSDKKAQAQERISKFREELVSARDENRSLRSQRENSIASKSRSELFRRPNANAQTGTVSANPFENAQMPNMDRSSAMYKESDALARASQNIDQFLEMGRSALMDLGEQNEMLRKTQKTMRKVANTLGISNETLRKVEKRAREDKLVFYGGAFTVLVIFYLIIRWFR